MDERRLNHKSQPRCGGTKNPIANLLSKSAIQLAYGHTSFAKGHRVIKETNVLFFDLL